ncbi:MAG: superoxide dismutase, partial [Erysipelotrichaceae bacterium]|nr:superoxide dismutase [Erysipelotrichaceae bacterium]
MFKQIELAYDFNALEPHVDALTMETHYLKHHAGYTKNLNDAATKAMVIDLDIKVLLSSLAKIEDEGLRTAIRNNGGGYYNHNLYFTTISPNGKREPVGDLAKAINDQLSGFGSLKEELTKLALGRFGSGWAWLSTDKQGKLYLSSTANQDNPLMDANGIEPILGIDVWEHAYYLKHKNLRGNYVKEFFEVIDWQT